MNEESPFETIPSEIIDFILNKAKESVVYYDLEEEEESEV